MEPREEMIACPDGIEPRLFREDYVFEGNLGLELFKRDLVSDVERALQFDFIRLPSVYFSDLIVFKAFRSRSTLT